MLVVRGAARFERQRLATGLSHQDLGMGMGRTRSFVWQVGKGLLNIHPEDAALLAEQLGCTVDYLFREVPPRPPRPRRPREPVTVGQ